MDTTPTIPAARPRRSGTRLRRVGATAATLASLVFVATACSADLPNAGAASPTPASTASQLTQGGSMPSRSPHGGSTHGTQGGASPAFIQCMRSHGMPNFPLDGRITPDTVDLGSSQFQDALNACKSLAPRGWVDSGSGPVGPPGGGS